MLGMSLSSLLDVSPAHDFLRGLLSLVQEFEAVPEERYGGKNVRLSEIDRLFRLSPMLIAVTVNEQQQKSLFKVGSRSKRGGASATSSGGADFSMGLPQEGGEATFLFTPNIVSCLPLELHHGLDRCSLLPSAMLTLALDSPLTSTTSKF